MKNLSLFAAAAVAVRGESYDELDQAIWLDRHNYFRTTGLPWSASNMRRIGWDAGLASKAASTATTCSATTDKGVNVYLASSNDATSAIDDAIEDWVVETAFSTLNVMPQPGFSGLDVGVGYYNSYSQVVWAETTSVGCASATCSDGILVVCEYSPAGNNENSRWYKHALQASECPAGTMASHGLCVKEGDDAAAGIASIPADKLTYQVYPSFVGTIHTLLLKSARDIANGVRPAIIVPKKSSETPSVRKGTNGTSSSVSNEDESVMSNHKTITVPSNTDYSFEEVLRNEDGQDNEGAGNGFSLEGEPENSLSLKAITAVTKNSNAATSMEAEEPPAELTTSGLIGMFVIGIGAVAGVLILVHVRKPAQH
ncbi:hypothetical protein CCR75_007014 [Bremia lactucae]|uniref:SCP domain-containing protein n=1 Tax=Bremia lactucae TaxID=4779 RepID=A0A976FH49_BRELC|nr:hypothetical protein CCR75_007014 [Bremia lactucae]